MVLNRRVQDFYRDNPLMVSSPFGGVDGIHRDLFLDVFETLGIDLNGKKVLDVGCGRGFPSAIVRDRGGSYTGADVVANGSGFALSVADAAALPFPDAAFDLVFCIDAFEHIPEPLEAAREFRRVLTDDGIFFLSAPNYSNVAGLVKKWCEAFGAYERDTWAPFRNWQPQELETFFTGHFLRGIARDAGFTRVGCIGHAAEVGLGLCPWIDHAKMPEAIKFRLQRLFNAIGPAVVRAWPGASLHEFWKIEV